jgi:hypothetical protein
MIVIAGAVLTFFIHWRMKRLASNILTAIFATVILYGALRIAWFQLTFTFGDDVEIVSVLFFSLWPLIFLCATGIYIYTLLSK